MTFNGISSRFALASIATRARFVGEPGAGGLVANIAFAAVAPSIDTLGFTASRFALARRARLEGEGGATKLPTGLISADCTCAVDAASTDKLTADVDNIIGDDFGAVEGGKTCRGGTRSSGEGESALSSDAHGGGTVAIT